MGPFHTIGMYIGHVLGKSMVYSSCTTCRERYMGKGRWANPEKSAPFGGGGEHCPPAQTMWVLSISNSSGIPREVFLTG